MSDEVVRCIHRHDIDHHPKCFVMGRIRQAKDREMQKKIRKELPISYKRVNLGDEPWYNEEGTKMGYFDIETSNFKANNGYLVSYAIKEKGNPDVIYDEITREEIFNGVFDRELIARCLESLNDFNIWITYYGTGFDIPFIRTRATYWYQRIREEKNEELSELKVTELKTLLESMLPEDRKVPSRLNKQEIIDLILDRDEELIRYEFPEYGSAYHFDLYYLVRAKFNLHRNSLGVATGFFGIEGKTHLSTTDWMLVRTADPEVMPSLKEHNIEDVIILEKLHEIVNPYRKWTRRSI